MKHILYILVFILTGQFCTAQIAPNFTITDTDSIEHKLYEDYLDKDKIVVVKMFFIDCPLCKPFNGPFQALYEELGSGQDDVEFLLLSTRSFDSNAEVAEYRTQNGLTYPGAGGDGGALDAVTPYTSGSFGVFFGSPSFLVIEPNRKVHYDFAASGVPATLQRVKDKIVEVQNAVNDSTSTEIKINVENYKGETLPAYTLRLRSASNPDSSYIIPDSFRYPSLEYPELDSAEVVVEITEKTKIGITTIDLVLIQRYLLDIHPLEKIQRLASDVNGSGTITPSDLLSIRKLILSISDGFSIGRSYLSIDKQCDESDDHCTEAIKIDRDLYSQEMTFSVLKFGDVR